MRALTYWFLAGLVAASAVAVGCTGDDGATGTSNGGGSGGSPMMTDAGQPAGPTGGKSDAGAQSMGGEAPGGMPATGDDGGTGGMADVATPDTTFPEVLSITPDDGSDGVHSDAAIVVTFSEPVKQDTAEAAFTSNAGVMTFAWNATGDELTATPKAPLAYTESENPDAVAKTYTVTVDTGVQDLAGNYLAEAATTSFHTLRKISISLSRKLVDTYIVSPPTLNDPPMASLADNDGGGIVGDGFSNEWMRVCPDFDITPIPKGVESIYSAALAIEMSVANPTGGGDWGKPVTDLGDLKVMHISDIPIDGGSGDITPLSTIGSLISKLNDSAGIKTVDVTEAVADDVQQRVARSNHSQYRIQFEKKTDNDANVDAFAVKPFSTMYIHVVYLIP